MSLPFYTIFTFETVCNLKEGADKNLPNDIPSYTATNGVLKICFSECPEKWEALDRALTLQELRSPVQHLSQDPAPTIDGSPAVF